MHRHHRCSDAIENCVMPTPQRRERKKTHTQKVSVRNGVENVGGKNSKWIPRTQHTMLVQIERRKKNAAAKPVAIIEWLNVGAFDSCPCCVRICLCSVCGLYFIIPISSTWHNKFFTAFMILLERTEVCVCVRVYNATHRLVHCHAMCAVCVYNSVDVICTSARFQTMLFYLRMQLFIEYTWFPLLSCAVSDVYMRALCVHVHYAVNFYCEWFRLNGWTNEKNIKHWYWNRLINFIVPSTA